MKTKSLKKAGFTLSETMLGLAIGMVVAGAAGWFLVEGTRISLKTSAASTNDLSEWGILTSITVDTKTANGMVMYSSFLKTTFSSSSNRLASGQTGNVLVLTQSTPNNSGSSSSAAIYTQLTGYVFDPTYSTFKKFVYYTTSTEKNPSSPASLETILYNNFDALVLQTLANNVKAVSTTSPLNSAFLCRDAGNQSGELNLQVVGGNSMLSTSSSKLIETSFFVRG